MAWENRHGYVRMLAEIICRVDASTAGSPDKKFMRFLERLDALVGGFYRGMNLPSQQRTTILRDAVSLTYLLIRPGMFKATLDSLKPHVASTPEAVRRAAIESLNTLLPDFGLDLRTPVVATAHKTKRDWFAAACARVGQCPSVGLTGRQVWNLVGSGGQREASKVLVDLVGRLDGNGHLECVPFHRTMTTEKADACDCDAPFPGPPPEQPFEETDSYVFAMAVADVAADIADLDAADREKVVTIFRAAQSAWREELLDGWGDAEARYQHLSEGTLAETTSPREEATSLPAAGSHADRERIRQTRKKESRPGS